MQKLISSLIVYHHNMKMLHWTCKGEEFDATHAYLDDMASKLNEFTDEIAEIMMSVDNVGNIPTLAEALSILDNDTSMEHIIINGSDLHDAKDCHEAVNHMLDNLYNIYIESHTNNDGLEYASDIISVLDDHMKWIRKENFYKMKLRLE